MTKPRVFIGSASEDLTIANAVAIELEAWRDPIVEVTVWREGVFGLNQGILETLLDSLNDFDFAIFIVAPNDIVTSQNIQRLAPRDNVLFEFGLFMGRLGRGRTFAVLSPDERLKVLSDLFGTSMTKYLDRSDGNWIAAVRKPCFDIQIAIKRELNLEQDGRIADSLSGRLVFLLRHIDAEGEARLPEYYLGVLPLYDCHTVSAKPTNFEEIMGEGWVKATQYACRYLRALKLVDPIGGSEIYINDYGRRVLGLNQTQQRFRSAYAQDLIKLGSWANLQGREDVSVDSTEEEMAWEAMKQELAAGKNKWRSVEMLAIKTGIDEAMAHKILLKNRGQITFSKGKTGHRIVRLIHPEN